LLREQDNPYQTMNRSFHYIIFFMVLRISLPLEAQDLILKEPVRFLAPGDSYTIGESVAVEERLNEKDYLICSFPVPAVFPPMLMR
jgi:hypothetical protein